MSSWLYHFFGLDNGSGSKYLFWSGSGSDIAELSLLGGIIALLRKHNCETHKCPRLGRHQWIDPNTGQTHHLCRKHHPLDHLTKDYILQVSKSDKIPPSVEEIGSTNE
jgi:hypothetical protein